MEEMKESIWISVLRINTVRARDMGDKGKQVGCSRNVNAKKDVSSHKTRHDQKRRKN